jgi:hypothetical protein
MAALQIQALVSHTRTGCSTAAIGENSSKATSQGAAALERLGELKWAEQQLSCFIWWRWQSSSSA